jgi:nicotinamidase-related amidase
MDRLDPSSSLLLLVDVQDRLAAAMPPAALDAVVANGRVLLEAARLLGVPVLATEQYPKGLGPTVGPLKEMFVAAGVQPIEKMTFDACGEPRVAQALAARSPRSVIVAGVEAHVCVFQTARELVRRGMSVCVVADAVASRREENRALGLGLAERAGAHIAPAETVVFDWLQRAGTEEFRALSKLLR